ncbi:MAG: hypothetical protein QOI42_480 [Frankiaceae bacterium]|nr:hypothetical protein [Frankiaceae bacterium]
MSGSTGRRAVASLVLGASGVGVLLARRPAALPPRELGPWRAGASVSDAAVAAAWAIGWCSIAWLSALAVLAAGTAIPGVIGTLCRLLLRGVAPRAVRRSLEVALGISLVAGPAFADVATASAMPAARGAVVQAVPQLDRPLDRPLGGPPRSAPFLDAPFLDAPFLDRPAPRPPLDRPVSPALRAVSVRGGDSLWLIAERGLGHRASDAEIAQEWPRWYAANRAVIGDDPDLIQPGEQLRPPPP